ncbi:unnamed protein product [Cylindrotheca closterium]|uniref:1-acyl-sn-glycerol-3-phosphate acyltransferase n=1 Tax=Cylindrotheca closterium TaxID=2856 RepID=A0AAD2FKP3_9STRA|nr:unnamed protein product [Cylindrotheca closterium]
MKSGKFVIATLLLINAPFAGGFVLPKNEVPSHLVFGPGSVLPQSSISDKHGSSFQATSSPSSDVPETLKGSAKNGKSLEELRLEGGRLSFNTPIGALNLFAIYYGLVSLFLAIPWFAALKTCQFAYWITGGRFDKKRRVPVFLSHVWGVALMRLTRSYPEIENLEILEKFYAEGKPAMFVANHCSWMDIPFLGAAVGWRNYKLVSKKELGIVPVLGTSIKVGGHIMVDRTDRRSQVRTLKQGINYLKKDGIHLCTFPEGTRSRTGRLMAFKNGAFKMAHKAGAPVIPLSIVNSHKVMPIGWMFAIKPSYRTAKVVVQEPVESVGRTEEELAEAVRTSMLSGLPDDQRPVNKSERMAD